MQQLHNNEHLMHFHYIFRLSVRDRSFNLMSSVIINLCEQSFIITNGSLQQLLPELSSMNPPSPADLQLLKVESKVKWFPL